MKILAIDPATNTGFAHSCGISGTWNLSIRRDESGGMRLLRLRGKLKEIYQTEGIDLVVYEAARHAAPKMQGALVVQTELQAVIKMWCEDTKVDYRGVSPSEVKKFATGKGNAGKPAMLEAASKRWPEKQKIGEDEADALWILEHAKHLIGEVTED